MTLVSKVGGASGPLYGTFFLRFGTALAECRDDRRGGDRRRRCGPGSTGIARPRQGRARRQDDVRRLGARAGRVRRRPPAGVGLGARCARPPRRPPRAGTRPSRWSPGRAARATSASAAPGTRIRARRAPRCCWSPPCLDARRDRDRGGLAQPRAGRGGGRAGRGDGCRGQPAGDRGRGRAGRDDVRHRRDGGLRGDRRRPTVRTAYWCCSTSGSAVLSAEMALEFVDPEVAERVRLSERAAGRRAGRRGGARGRPAPTSTRSRPRRDAGLLGKQDHLGDARPASAGPDLRLRPGRTVTVEVT